MSAKRANSWSSTSFFFFGLFFEGERQKKKFHFFHFSIFIFKELFLYQGKFYKSASRKIQFRTIAIRGDSFVKMVVYILKKKRKRKKPTVLILSFSFSFSFYQWLYLWHRGNSVSLISSDILTWVDKEIEIVDEIRPLFHWDNFPPIFAAVQIEWRWWLKFGGTLKTSKMYFN